MNKRLKKKLALELLEKKYHEIGRVAAKRPRIINHEDKDVYYIEFDNVGLATYRDNKFTYFKDIKGNVDFDNFEDKDSFQAYMRALYVIQGFYKNLMCDDLEKV